MTAEREIESLLSEHGAVLERTTPHKVYRLPNGKKFVLPSTPSDPRSYLNCLSDLRRALGIRRRVCKNPDRKAKPGAPGQKRECFECVDLKEGWRKQLAAAVYWAPEEKR